MSGKQKHLPPFETRVKPGQCLNPTGKTNTRLRALTPVLLDKLNEPDPQSNGKLYMESIADRLVKTAAHSARDSQATDAALAIADRIEGRPIQAVHVLTQMDPDTMQILSRLAERLLAQAPPEPPTITARIIEEAPPQLLPETPQAPYDPEIIARDRRSGLTPDSGPEVIGTASMFPIGEVGTVQRP